jgi:electron transport complex protein RnfC
VLQVVAAVRDGSPVLDRLVTVARGGDVKVLRAALGSSFVDIARGAGHDGLYGKHILGGSMQGLSHYTLDYPLAKHLPGLTLQEGAQVVHDRNDPCISCGLCAMACPMRLVPGMLSRYCEYGDWEAAENAHLFTCIECGCCAYVCPAGRSMVQLMVHGKNEVLATRRTG